MHLVTQNVKGLNENFKRRGVFMHLRSKADIICIQETHCTVENENIWSQEWGGKCFWSNGTSVARGCAILVNPKFQGEILNVAADAEGRYVLVQILEDNEKFVLISVYAPNEDSPQFWIELFKRYENYEGHRIIAGDFNLALNVVYDRSNKNAKNNHRSAEVINQYLEDTYMYDIWRQRNPDKMAFTFFRHKPKFTGSRIDYILSDATLSARITKINITPGFKSDHSAILMQLNVKQVEKGRGYWKLNTNVILEKEYVDKINQIIQETVIRCKSLDKRETWEMVKLHIICTSQSYCEERARNRNLIIAQLEQAIQKYESNIDSLNEYGLKLLDRTKTDHEGFMDAKAQSAIFRTGCTFYNEAEKSTKYFFALEKSRAGAKNMSSILNKDGTVSHDLGVILKELHSFYSKLYTSDESVHFDYQNVSGIRLNS